MTSDGPASRSEWLFARLLVLLPHDFRNRFGADMRELFRDQQRAAQTRGGLEPWRVGCRSLLGLARVAILERGEARRSRHAGHALSERRSSIMIDTVTSDVRFAVRMLRKNPVFTVVAVLCISIGSGAVTTIFSAMNAILLRPLPGAADGDRLVTIERRSPDSSEGTSASYAYYRHLRDHTRTLDGLAAWTNVSLSIAAPDTAATAVYGNIVSGNYFSILGVRPALGRFFLPEEDRTPLTHPVIVVSDGFWRSRLGGDAAAIGRTVRVNGHPFTVVGVAPRGFRGVFTPIDTSAWVPLMMQPQLRPGRDLDAAPWLRLFGRMTAGTDRQRVHVELTTLTAGYMTQAIEPASAANYSTARVYGVTGLPEDASRAVGGFIAILLAAATLVLLIASVNVASMLSARGIARAREMAVRAALGAGRGRLVRQLLTESLLLFVLGAAGGIALAYGATAALEQVSIPSDVPLSMTLSPDRRVLAFALVLSLVTGLVFGLTPALRSASRDITARLRAHSAGSGTRRTIMSQAWIVGQLALSLLLLVAAGLFLRALDRGHRLPPGFETASVATFALNTESWGYDDERGRAFYRTLRARLAARPGVIAVSATGVLPLTFGGTGTMIQPDGGNMARLAVGTNAVDVDYFTVLRLPLLQGRGFAASDDAGAARVAIVNETLARRLSPDGGALGRSFGMGQARITIVGIARDARYSDLGETTPAFVYLPMAQAWQSNQTILVRTAGDGVDSASEIGSVVRAIDPQLPPPTAITLEQATSIVLLPQRIGAMVTGALGMVGLLLATVGLYGVMAYATIRRTREIGVRLALGAQRWDVVRMILRDGMRLAGFGVTAGVLLAAAATRALSGFLFGVSPMDGLTYGGMSLLFASVALVASYLPARRAAACDPVTALRAD